jgi:hypothetical protein
MLFFSVAGFVTLYALQRVVLVQPVHDQHDRALKLVISVSLRPNNERRHGPPPDRPARRCAHAIKRRGLHKVATIRLTAPAYWKFESIPLQQRVRLSPDFARVPDKARVFRQFGDDAGRHGRQRRAKPSNIEPRSGSVSVELYSSTGVLPDSVREIGGAGRKRRRFLGVSDLGGALSSDRLKQSRARSADHAKPAADASVPAACRQSDRAAGAHRGWLA